MPYIAGSGVLSVRDIANICVQKDIEKNLTQKLLGDI
jgi:hypothetical protein